MKFKFIKPNDLEYPAELMLRWEVLFKPQGRAPGSEVETDEDKSLHLVALEGKKVVGCVLFYQENEGSGRLYQMALSEEYQGRGFGRKLLVRLEQTLQNKGIKEIHLEVNKEAVGFYLAMGFHKEASQDEPKTQQKLSKSISHGTTL